MAIYNDFLRKSIISGAIRKVDDDDIVVSVSSTVKDSTRNDDKSYSMKLRTYDDMTIQEKRRSLENERTNALNEIDELLRDRGYSPRRK